MSALAPHAVSDLPGNRWHVQMLGGLQLSSGDLRIARFPDRPTLLLFARLALQPHVLHGRDSLAQLLWPEVLDAGGRYERDDAMHVRRERLRKTLSRLAVLFRTEGTQHVEPFHAERDTLRLNAAAFDIDVHRFDRHCGRRQHDAARACYGGELLPGLSADWLDSERARLAAARTRLDDGDADDIHDDDEPSAPAPPVTTTMPPARRHFFGRENELDGVRRALQSHRLVTLVGTGGCGKTTLAAQVARQPQGYRVVALVWLEDCAAADGIVDRVRAALDLQRDGGDPLRQIAAHLAGERTLLVLDNFEQLVGDGGNAEIDRLLQALPAADLLVTTRRALQHPAEHCVALGTLPLPDPGDTLAAAGRNPSVAVFVAAARAARADFSLNRRNLAGVVAVCRQLEGLPLSIELAAARIRSFAPREMAEALEHSSRLLTRAPASARGNPRHASLTAALTWSWRLLDEAARAMLRRLALFRGGWTLEQAHDWTGATDVDAALATLAAASLLQPLPADDGAPRLALLVVLREFVLEQCSPAQLALLRSQHRALFCAWAQRHADANTWPANADEANFAAALDTACADGDDAAAIALASALGEPWRARSASKGVVDCLQALAQRTDLPAAVRVDMLLLRIEMLVNGGRGRQAQAETDAAFALADGSALLRARALAVAADVLSRAGRTPAELAQALDHVLQAESLLDAAQARDVAGTRLLARVLLLKGRMTLIHLRQVDAAAAQFERAERLFRAVGDRRSGVVALPGRCACLLQQGRHQQVIAVAGKGEREAAELGDVTTQLQLLDRLSNCHEATGNDALAVQACRRQARVARQHGMNLYANVAIWNQCLPLARLGELSRAVRMLAFACRHWADDVGSLDADDHAYRASVRQLARVGLGTAGLRAAWARGEALTLHEALQLAAGNEPETFAGRPSIR